MPLTLHHLHISQSERILFLLEELGVAYELKTYTRDPLLAPASFKSLPSNTTGQAPFLTDSDTNITLSESGAITEYILQKYWNEGGERLVKKYGDEGFRDYVYFLHFANATLHPAASRLMFLTSAAKGGDNPTLGYAKAAVTQALEILNTHLEHSKWLAGSDFTAADCMMVYSLSTGRYWVPRRYDEYPHIVRYLGDIGGRAGYQRAMEKGDPEMRVLLGVEGPEKGLMEVGGVGSDIWKK